MSIYEETYFLIIWSDSLETMKVFVQIKYTENDISANSVVIEKISFKF